MNFTISIVSFFQGFLMEISQTHLPILLPTSGIQASCREKDRSCEISTKHIEIYNTSAALTKLTHKHSPESLPGSKLQAGCTSSFVKLDFYFRQFKTSYNSFGAGLFHLICFRLYQSLSIASTGLLQFAYPAFEWKHCLAHLSSLQTANAFSLQAAQKYSLRVPHFQ